MKTAVLFDADGVLTLPEEYFSVVYTRSHGLDPEPFERFFKTEWRDFVTGKRDLKQAIAEDTGLWQWHGSPESLLDYWFKVEDVRNDELIRLLQDFGQQDIACYLATEQEQYRAAYMRDVMFAGLFRDQFVTADIGFTKGQPEFYEAVLERLRTSHPGIQPADILFFDDSQSKVDVALSVGIDARLYTGVDQVRSAVLGESEASLNVPRES